jgi:hypothetical protein
VCEGVRGSASLGGDDALDAAELEQRSRVAARFDLGPYLCDDLKRLVGKARVEEDAGTIRVVTHLPPLACGSLDIDPNSDSNQILNNTATGNGLSPDSVIAPLPGADLLWDGTGTLNCWQDNTANTTFPAPLPTCR